MTGLHPIFEQALKPFAPPPLSDAEREAIDQAMLLDKQPRPGNPLVDGYEQRRQANALRLQMHYPAGEF